MLNKSILAVCLASTIQIAMAQQDPKHINCYKDVSIEDKNVSIQIEDAVSRADFNKFKIKLTNNNTTDYLLFIPKETIFDLEGNTYSPKETKSMGFTDNRKMILAPMEKGSRVVEIKGGGVQYHVKNYTYTINGLYSIPSNSPAISVPNFKLPASVNDFTADNFKVSMTKIKKETSETVVKFEVTYLGSNYGLVDPNKLGVKLENGQEFANAKTKQDLIILAKGESDTFIAQFQIPGKVADMQFANMEILWRDTFKEASLKKLDVAQISVVLDEGKTAGKNK